MSDLVTLVEFRLLAWLSLLTLAGTSAIVWHAILDTVLTYEPPPPPLPSHLLRDKPSRPRPPSTTTLTRHHPALLVEPAESGGPSASGAVPFDLARARVRELGGLYQVSERLGMRSRAVLDLLKSERPLPPWVLDVLFEDREADERLPPPTTG